MVQHINACSRRSCKVRAWQFLSEGARRLEDESEEVERERTYDVDLPLPRCSHVGELWGGSALIALGLYFGVDSINAFCGESNVRSIVKYLAVMCLLLTFWSAIAFAAHHHSNGTEAAKCTVCVAAHSAAPKATAILLKAKFTPISTFLPEPVFAAQSFVAFALSVRPPPAI